MKSVGLHDVCIAKGKSMKYSKFHLTADYFLLLIRTKNRSADFACSQTAEALFRGEL